MPKNARHGQAEIWEPQIWREVNEELSTSMGALFSICYYTCCRVSESRTLSAEDLTHKAITFRKANTKTKQTRTVAIHPELAAILAEANLPKAGYLFPGRSGRPITRQAADKALRLACDRLGLTGYSTHSFRRTAATRMRRKGADLRVIQKVGGWASLQALQRYLDVTEAEMESAVNLL